MEEDHELSTDDTTVIVNHVPQEGAPTTVPMSDSTGQQNVTTESSASKSKTTEIDKSKELLLDAVESLGVIEPSQQPPETESNVEISPRPTMDNMPSSEIKALSKPDMSVIRLVEKADHSAGKLVNLLVKYFPSFRDEAHFNGRKVRFFKRAQIFVADLWAACNGTGYGEFGDIGHLTMFAGKSVTWFRSKLRTRPLQAA